jgi:pilus assembly protein CpaE
MKISIISPNTTHLREMAAVLSGLSHEVATFEGGKSRMRAVAEQESPDLLLVEGICCDPAELAHVEYLSTHLPDMAVVLLCSTHTPEFLMHSMRVGVREVLPSPASDEALEAMAARVQAKLKGPQTRPQGKILAFVPCKGGSGATFLATNIGFQLAQTHSVLLVDLNLQFGDALSFVYDGKPTSTLADVARDIARLDASLLAASAVTVAPNYRILAAPEDPSQAMEIKPEHIDAVLSIAAAEYDFVLLDMGRTLDTMSLKAFDRAWRIFPVLQAGLPALRHATKLLAVFRSLGYPGDKIELVFNRADKGAAIGLQELRRAVGKVAIRTVPGSDREVSDSIDQGTALVTMARSSPVARSLAEFAESLVPRAEPKVGLLGRIFKRA